MQRGRQFSPNKIEMVDENTVKMYLTRNQVHYFHIKHYNKIKNFRWHAKEDKHTFYVYSFEKTIEGKQVAVIFHRLITDAKEGEFVDHRDCNGLNNLDSNLRICTKQQNNMNTRIRVDNTSGYKNISWSKSKSKWLIKIRIGSDILVDTTRKNIEDAIKLRDEMMKKFHGEFVRFE